MAPNQDFDLTVYSGTYSNVPVYELRLGANMVFRRRSDNYINATHILKVADLDKPARTRVLEKEVQLGVHEKVQGGYGKYQGTWIPLESAVDLAKKYAVYPLLQPLFDFQPGAQSPPPAPKHTTASSNRNKASRASAASRTATQAQQQQQHQQQHQQHQHHQHQQRQAALANMSHDHSYDYDDGNELPREDESFDNTTVASFVDEDDYQVPGSRTRKRKRDADRNDSPARFWADSLLDYYVVSGSDPVHQAEYAPPPPPAGVDVNRPIDNEGHTALHWAAAMGDVEYVKDLMSRDADIFVGNVRGETPLIKCSIFSNCYDKGTYQAMLRQLSPSLTKTDNFGATVLHHITKSTLSVPKGNRARYYLDVALDQLEKNLSQPAFFEFASKCDQNGDTAFHIAVRASRRCTRVFQSKGIPCDVPNQFGETVEKMLRDKDEKAASRRKHLRGSNANNMPLSSSPVVPSSPMPFDLDPVGGRMGGPMSNYDDLFSSGRKSYTRSSENFRHAMMSMCSTSVNQFIEAGEQELAEKDELLADIEAALSRVMGQIIACQQETQRNEAEPAEDIAQLSEERARLSRLAEAYSEQMQHRFLHQAIRDGESKARSKHDRKNGSSSHSGDANGSGNGNSAGGIDDKEIAERIRLARLLHEAQEERKKLTAELVEAQAQAGMDESGEQAIRVLMKTLNTSRDKVITMVPDLLEEMELGKRDQAIAMEHDLE